MTEEEWSTQEVVKATGITSRTLRHYDRIGLLPPSRTGYGGQRFYDRGGLLRLQQILVLRELGLGLAGIGRVLDEGRAAADVLREHLAQLEQERSEEHTSELQSRGHLVCRLLLEKKKKRKSFISTILMLCCRWKTN